jgi:predicted phage terminase large subunit-like protein
VLQAKIAAQIGKKVAARLIEGTRDRASVDSDGLIEREYSAIRSTEHDSLTAFKRAVYGKYIHAKHLALIDWHLEQVTKYVETDGKEGIGQLIIAVPPRHGKTLTVSRLYPTWHIGRNPSHRIMAVSYGQSLANRNSRFARNLLRKKQYKEIFPHTKLASDSRSVLSWDIEGTDGEGGMEALGVTGASAGKGAHILIVDDPIKNRKMAESLTYRESIWDSFNDDFRTRLEPSGATIVMATRWHEDDLTGRLLKNEPGEWVVLNLPALAVDEDIEGNKFIDPLGRNVGEALWPERYNKERLEAIQKKRGDYSWSSLFQQMPMPSEGGIMKAAWFKPFVRVIPETVRAVRYWDLAMSEKTSADYTVGLRIELGKNGEHYITDIAREQVEFGKLPEFIAGVMITDGPSVHQGFEDKGFMTRAVKAVAKDPRLSKHVIKGYEVDGDKRTRALPFAARAQLGLIHLKQADWSQAYVDEAKGFPYGAHDDQIDASSGAWGMINEEPRKPPTASTTRWA